MGVDHDGVGGIGIKFTGEIRNQCIARGLFTEEEWDDDLYECMDKIGINWQEAGSYAYGGDLRMYLVMPGCKTLGDAIANGNDFCGELAKIGVTIEMKDLLIIQDIHVW